MSAPLSAVAVDRLAWAIQFDARAERMAREGKTVEASTLRTAADRQRCAVRQMAGRPTAEMGLTL